MIRPQDVYNSAAKQVGVEKICTSGYKIMAFRVPTSTDRWISDSGTHVLGPNRTPAYSLGCGARFIVQKSI